MARQVKKNNYVMLAGVIVAVLAVAGLVSAYSGVATYVIENVENLTINGSGAGLGAAPSGDYTAFTDIYVEDELNVDGTATFTGAFALSGALTAATSTIAQPDATIQFDLDFTTATGTGSVATPDTEILVGSWANTTGPKLCNMVAVDLTANSLFAYDLKVGTSTSATSSDAHLITANTAAGDIPTSTDTILSKEDDEGTTTAEVWNLEQGEYIVVTQTIQAANATSSASFTAAGGNTGAGKVHVNCWNTL